MHRIFRKALDTAEGHSKFVIVVVLDIREFSRFSNRHESPDTAMYIKRVYMRLIDNYFDAASFYKSTGDGLLVTIPYTESTLEKVASDTVKSSLKCHEEFAHICDNDPMVNFDVPTGIGIGIARGTACCLKSKDLVLDYSGHILNLASRLMNIARPSGIIIDGDFTMGLLDDQDQELFEKKAVYIRSIAEESPKTVYILKDAVDILPEYLQPLRVEQWESIQEEKTVKQWKEFIPSYRIDLNKPLRRPDAIKMTIVHPLKVKGRFDSGYSRLHYFEHFEYSPIAGEPRVRVNVDEITKLLTSEKLTSNIKVKLKIDYLPKIL